MDPVQILLFVVVTVLTVLLVAVGVQAFLILREARDSLRKINGILEDANFISHSVTRPIEGINSFMEGIRSFRDLVDLLLNKGSSGPQIEEGYEGEQYEEQEQPEHVQSLQERGRRFFHKEGRPLS